MKMSRAISGGPGDYGIIELKVITEFGTKK